MPRDLTVSTLHPKDCINRWTPPFQRLPRWEMRFWPCFIMLGYMAIPSWILYHLPDYRGGVGPHQAYLRKQAANAAKEA